VSPASDGELRNLGYASSELPNEALAHRGPTRRLVPTLCGAHRLFDIVVNEIAACPRLADPLDGDYRFEKSLARLAVAALVRTWDMAARCRNQGGPGASVLDISFPRW